MKPSSIAVSVDVGGTFTDIVYLSGDNKLNVLKVPTSRPSPSDGMRQGLLEIAGNDEGFLKRVDRFVHGTTVATNAVLERKGSPTGLLVTEGFRDVLEIGRSFRPNMYDVFVDSGTPIFLAGRSRRLGVKERIGPKGEVIQALDEASAREAIRQLVDAGVEAIAVAFLFSFVNPEHELRVAELIAEIAPSMHVSLSHQVDPAFREFERTCITAFDAYVKPKLSHYLKTVSEDLASVGVPANLQVMQSRGGLSNAGTAVQRPVRLFLSGPAGGVMGARGCGGVAGEHDLITFDVGGTSCDIALIQDGQPLVKPTSSIDGYMVRVPMVDVNAIGSGGGSIAWLDVGGGLRVGPHSAGSVPGPACYSKGGEEATVTDASVVLGYINPDYFAAGSLKLDPKLAHKAVKEKIADSLGMSVVEAALGIHRVVNAQMSEGIRLISVKRGIDPRDFTLVPLGGGGGMHATALADDLGMDRILVPVYPGVLAACGLLVSPVQHEASVSFQSRIEDTTLEQIEQKLAGLVEQCRELMALENAASDFELNYSADICFVGQSHTLAIPLNLEALRADGGSLRSLSEAFVQEHRRIYGHGEPGPTRIVNLGAVASVSPPWSFDKVSYETVPATRGGSVREAIFNLEAGPVKAKVVERHSLAVGDVVVGPAILEQSDTTTLVSPGWTATVITGGNIMMERN